MKSLAKILAVLIVLAVGLVLSLLISFTGPRSGTRAYLGIINTLRQIDGAKQQYAIDHHAPPETVLSREQLLEYLPERFWDSHATYRINALSESPEAVLPTAFDGFPAGTVIRLQTNVPGHQIVLPNHAGSGPRDSALFAYNASGAGPLLRSVANLYENTIQVSEVRR